MILSDIETVVLMNIGGTRYSKLSASTTADDIEDFATLHKCVLFAREEIKLYANIPSILKKQTVTTVASQKAYDLASDFDIPEKVVYITTDGTQDYLTQLYLDNFIQKKSDITAVGTPDSYMIIGNSSNLIQMELYDTPENASETCYVYYKPILSNITVSTDYDVIMAKYANTVIKLASAYGFFFLRKDKTQFDSWYLKGMSDIPRIDMRETGADSAYKEIPDALLRARRMSRLTK